LAQTKIILASASPRRKYLLEMLFNNFGLKFDVIPANIVEDIPKKNDNFGYFVEYLAQQKAENIGKLHKGIIIGADTIVILNKTIMGKPENKKKAVEMLNNLSGKSHKVFTGLAIIDTKKNKIYKTHEITTVKFRKLNKKEIGFYVNSGSPMDKAGAYGIQDDFGSTFVEKITGDYFNVVGLPMVKTYLGLRKFLQLSF